jgi:hypothetical protein
LFLWVYWFRIKKYNPHFVSWRRNIFLFHINRWLPWKPIMNKKVEQKTLMERLDTAMRSWSNNWSSSSAGLQGFCVLPENVSRILLQHVRLMYVPYNFYILAAYYKDVKKFSNVFAFTSASETIFCRI